MDTGGPIRAGLLLLACACVATGSPIGTSDINCALGSNGEVGQVNEGYSGEVEVVRGITGGVKLVPHIFPTHLQFLELSFTPGDATATVRTTKPLDADVLAATDSTLYYSVMCDDITKYNNTRTLKINDLNDNKPIFGQKSYSASVSEIHSVDSMVLQVSAVDADSTPANNRVAYSIEPTSEDFMVTNSGAFILKRSLNYNIVQKYNFIVTAKDNGGLNDTASVLITVEDFDNMNPYFSHNVYQAFIPENQVGPFRALEPEAIKAQDGDLGINMTLTYSISSVSPDKYRTNFGVDFSSGAVSVLTALDREEMASSEISVSIKAAQTDDALKTAGAVVSVFVEDVNDNPPEFDRPAYSVSLLENSPFDGVVFKAAVSDLDQGGFVGTLRIIPESSPFSVGSDGTVRVKKPSDLDRETTESFRFEIEAKETDPPNAVVVVEVNVTLLDENDNGPSFSSKTYEGKVFANQTVGMQLVQVKAEDPDAGVNGQIKYFIDFGNNDGFFSIEEDSGEISLARTIPLLENQILKFPLYITARDGGAISRSSSAQVNIRAPGDCKPQFLHEVYRGTVEEEREPGVFILRVDFLAVAAEIPVTLRVDSEADKFVITDGGEFSTRVKLDYDEAPHNYSVGISISDGVNSNRAVVEVQVTDVNDNSPVFASGSATAAVPEDAEAGSNVTSVTATDKDSGFNGDIRYSLRGGQGRFSVDPVSGTLSVDGALDREAEAEYNLLLVAEDQGRPSRSATASLLVQVTDVNDNVPEFSQAEYRADVFETESVGTSLLTLSAADPDEEANGRVTFSIFQQSPSSEPPVFELESSSGVLRLARPLDYSEVKAYSLQVQASDGGAPSLVGNGSVVVTVRDVNNNPPEFSKEIYNVAVSESLASGASVLTLEVTDPDEGGFSNGYFLFANDTFDINKQGVVSLRNDVTLDRETKDSYMIQVVAVDQVAAGLSATARLNVSVLDYNDNAPQFPSLPDPFLIAEGEYSEVAPGDVFTIEATDADLGPNGEVTLSLLRPHPLFRFREDGTLLAVGSLDRERQETYELFVKASDGGRPQRENITAIRVSLLDVNDNRPQFSSSSYVSTVLLKEAEEGKLLLTLSASDRDAGNNSLIAYSFSAGSSPYLALNSETGAVTLTSDLADVTEDTRLELTAVAKDHGRPPLNSTARVVVNLRVANLMEGVAFLSSSYNFSLPENQAAGAPVGKVSASSGTVLYDVAYALKTHADLFSVSPSGALVTRTELDREEQEWYILDVEAVDTRTPPTSAFAMVRVQVQDVNESPRFPSEVHRASVFSIAPYKTPVIRVEASDPDQGEASQLVYGLTEDSPHFDVDPSSGQLFVVSAAGLAGQTAAVEVEARDPRGLSATTRVEVEVKGSVSSGDVVVLSINQPANAVEKKLRAVARGDPVIDCCLMVWVRGFRAWLSLGSALGWTVSVIEVSSATRGSSESRAPRVLVEARVGFLSFDRGEVVPSEEVTEKLRSQSAALRAELVKVFGEGLHFEVEVEVPKSPSPASSQAVVIALSVMLALSMLGMIVAVAMIVRFKWTQKCPESDKEGLVCDEKDENSQKGQRSEEKVDKDMQPRTDRVTEDGDSHTSSL